MRIPCLFLCVLVPVKGPEVGQSLILHSFHVVTINLNQSNINSI